MNGAAATGHKLLFKGDDFARTGMVPALDGLARA